MLFIYLLLYSRQGGGILHYITVTAVCQPPTGLLCSSQVLGEGGEDIINGFETKPIRISMSLQPASASMSARA